MNLFVKRDDLTGSDLSGNKIRKLEYLLADAQAQGCDTIITCGAVGSNHARATTLAARRLGMETSLVLAGDPPSQAHGNLQLELLAGASVRFIGWKDYTERIDQLLDETAESLRRQGKKPYTIPTGGSNAVGLFGYVACMEEIVQQFDVMGGPPDWIVCAVGSGGTFAGLVLGNALLGSPTKILGILVCNTVSYFRSKVEADLQDAAKRFGVTPPANLDTHRLVSAYIGGGYAKTTYEQLDFLRMVAQREAIILDPVYTNKALFGLRGEINKGQLKPGQRTLFIHSGGVFGLSAFAGEMTMRWDGVTSWRVKT